MRKMFVAALTLLASIQAFGFDVVVRHGDGADIYTSDQIASVEFSPKGDVGITFTDGTAASISADQFESLSFDRDDVNSVSQVAYGASALRVEGCDVVSADGARVAIYDVKGSECASGVGRVSLASLPAGAYIVTDGVKSIKILLP